MNFKHRNEIISSYPQYSGASPVQLENAAFNRSNDQVSHVNMVKASQFVIHVCLLTVV